MGNDAIEEAALIQLSQAQRHAMKPIAVPGSPGYYEITIPPLPDVRSDIVRNMHSGLAADLLRMVAEIRAKRLDRV